MKVPSKKELYDKIEYLESECIKYKEELNSSEKNLWYSKLADAEQFFIKHIPFSRSQVNNIQLDHIDSSGYYFKFNVIGDRTQTYVVRHNEISSSTEIKDTLKIKIREKIADAMDNSKRLHRLKNADWYEVEDIIFEIINEVCYTYKLKLESVFNEFEEFIKDSHGG